MVRAQTGMWVIDNDEGLYVSIVGIELLDEFPDCVVVLEKRRYKFALSVANVWNLFSSFSISRK